MTTDYLGSLAAHGLADVQPLYRRLLVRLKAEDERAYEAAVSRYRDDVEAAVGDAEDPLAIWIAYGVWLAPRITPGVLMTVDENGRALPARTPPPLGPMLMHVPEDGRQRAIVLAMPAEPSPAQKETAALLCG